MDTSIPCTVIPLLSSFTYHTGMIQTRRFVKRLSPHHWTLQHGGRLPLLSARPAFYLRKRSPDGATPNLGNRHPIAAYYLSIDPEDMKG